MTIKSIAASAVLSTMLSPVAASAQYVTHREHEEAKRAQTRSDHRHHTGAKIVVGSAAGGAVIGALAGGSKGAIIGGAVGAGGGAVANKVSKDRDVRNRERTGRY